MPCHVPEEGSRVMSFKAPAPGDDNSAYVNLSTYTITHLIFRGPSIFDQNDNGSRIGNRN